MKNLHGFTEMVSEIYYVLSKKERKQALTLLIMMLCGSLLELLGVSAIVPFVQAVVTPEQLKEGKITGAIWNVFSMDKLDYPVVVFGIFLIIIYLFKNAFLILYNF